MSKNIKQKLPENWQKAADWDNFIKINQRNKVKSSFWKKEKLDPRFITAQGLNFLFGVFCENKSAWEEIFKEGLEFHTLHPKNRIAREVEVHPARYFILNMLSPIASISESCFECLIFLKNNGLNLKAKDITREDMVSACYRHFPYSAKQSFFTKTFKRFEELDLSLTSRDAKGNMLIHKAILNGSWNLIEALIIHNSEAWAWTGEHNRTTEDFLEKKFKREKASGHVLPNPSRENVIALYQTRLLQKNLPESLVKPKSVRL